MMADDGLALIRVIADGVYHAGVFTAAAADTFMRVEVHAASRSSGKRAGRTNFGAPRFVAGHTYRSDKLAGQSAGCFNMYTAFYNGMAFLIYSGANKHTSETADTFVHFIRFQYLGQIHPSIF